MSTRCQMGIYEKKDAQLEDWDVLLYKHSDGYPGKEDGSKHGILPDIIPFLKRFDGKRGIDDVEYCGAWLMHHLIEQHIEGTKKMAEKLTHIPTDGKDFMGHGICKQLSEDITYFYKIYPSGIDVYEVSSDIPPGEWKRIKRISLEKK